MATEFKAIYSRFLILALAAILLLKAKLFKLFLVEGHLGNIPMKFESNWHRVKR